MWKRIVYVDHLESPCQMYRAICKEYEVRNSEEWTLYRCVYCHDKEILALSCLGTRSDGTRCRRDKGLHGGYCTDHYMQATRRYSDTVNSFSLGEFDKWEKSIEHVSVITAKINIIKRIALQEEITVAQLRDLLDNYESYVYFIECEGFVKIGKAVNVQARLKQLKSPADGTLKPFHIDMKKAKLLGSITGGLGTEAMFHRELESHRVEGEWFKLNTKVAQTIELALENKIDLSEIVNTAKNDPFVVASQARSATREELGVLNDKVKDLKQLKEYLLEVPKERVKSDPIDLFALSTYSKPKKKVKS